MKLPQYIVLFDPPPCNCTINTPNYYPILFYVEYNIYECYFCGITWDKEISNE